MREVFDCMLSPLWGAAGVGVQEASLPYSGDWVVLPSKEILEHKNRVPE